MIQLKILKTSFNISYMILEVRSTIDYNDTYIIIYL